MHVAMVLRQFSPHGGLELYAFQLVKGLLERGTQVTVICEIDESSFVHENLRVNKFAPATKDASKAEKIKHYYTAASEAVSKLGPFDLVHSQHLPLSNADVVTFHNHTVFRLSEVGQKWEQVLNNFKIKFSSSYKLRDHFDRLLCHRARCLIFPARICMDDFQRHYETDGKVLAVAHPGAGMVSDSTSLRREIPNTSATVAFLFVGKGYRKKGLDILFEACRLLKERSADFKLLIAGLRAKPIDQLRIAGMGLTDHIEYLGFQKDMDSVYQRAQNIILPSRIEPFGMAPIQGMLRGLVPIVSRVCGVQEVLKNEVDSLILENHLSACELSNLMHRLINDPQLMAQLSNEAMKTSASLTWDKTVDATIAAYNATLAVPTSSKSPNS